jgi:hypothetical protein
VLNHPCLCKNGSYKSLESTIHGWPTSLLRQFWRFCWQKQQKWQLPAWHTSCEDRVETDCAGIERQPCRHNGHFCRQLRRQCRSYLCPRATVHRDVSVSSCAGSRGTGYPSSAETLTVDSVFSDLVADDTFSGMQQLRCLGPITTRRLQGILNQVTFKGLNGIRQ